MASWVEAICFWLIDYYLAATVLLVLIGAALHCVRQPARRVAIVWGGFIGLAILAALCTLPEWPRFHIIPGTAPAQFVASASHSQEVGQIGLAHTRERVESSEARAKSGLEQKLGLENTVSKDRTEGRQPIQRSAKSNPPTSSRPVFVRSVDTIAKYAPDPESRAPLVSRDQFLLASLLVFFAGYALTALRVLHGVHAAMVLCRRASPPPLSVLTELDKVVGDGGRKPRLLMSSAHSVPIATGTVRPTILLPWQFAAEQEVTDCRSVLAHEWAHIRNGDLWLLAMDRWLLPLLWAQPVYHWLSRSIRNDQELLADASAAAQSSPVAYAAMLLHWARRIAAEKRSLEVSGALGGWNRPSRLADRITKLLHPNQPLELRCSRAWRCGSIVALSVIPILLSTATVRPAAPSSMTLRRLSASTPSRLAASIGPRESAAQSAASRQATSFHSQWEFEQEAIAAVRRLGGFVKTQVFGDCRLVTEVNMVYGYTEDGQRIDNTIFTEEAVWHIARFRNLRALALAGPQVTDRGLDQIARLDFLERLCFWDAQAVSNAGMARIAALPRLKALELSNVPIDDASIGHLLRLPALEELSIQGSALTDRAIASIVQLSKLKRLVLDFGDNEVDPAALAQLRQLTNLEQFGLRGSRVSNAGLDALGGLKDLRVLILGETRIDEMGIARMRRSLPNLHLVTAERTYPALATGETSEACEQSIRHSQEAVAIIRKMLARVGAGKSEAAADLFCPKVDARRQLAEITNVGAAQNVEWKVAYMDPAAVIAVSTEFAGSFGEDRVLTCVLKCTEGTWRAEEIAVALAGEGVHRKVRSFALAHPESHPAKGWLPVRNAAN